MFDSLIDSMNNTQLTAINTLMLVLDMFERRTMEWNQSRHLITSLQALIFDIDRIKTDITLFQVAHYLPRGEQELNKDVK